MLDIIKSLVDVIVQVDTKVGFKKGIIYLSVILLFIGGINIQSIFKLVVEYTSSVSSGIHLDKLEKRDELMTKLYPILTDLRSEAGADRLLYFEYHNSKENMVSIPFKYFDLVQQTCRHDIQEVDESKYEDINTGAITDLYNYIKHGETAYCSGEGDRYFRDRFPGTWTLFNTRDQANRLLFVSIPGIDQPVGFIVLEWIDEDGEEVKPVNIVELERIISHHYIPTINALILSKSGIKADN